MNWTTTYSLLVLTLSLLISGWVKSQLYDHYGRKLRITPKECKSSSPRFEELHGVCMFNLECQEQSGTVIGACVDRFLFGACCHIPEHLRNIPHPTPISLIESQTGVLHSTKPNRDNVISIISDISSTIASESSSSSSTIPIRIKPSSSFNQFSPSTFATFAPHPNPTKNYPTRFPLRSSSDPLVNESSTNSKNGMQTNSYKDETMDHHKHSHYVISNRERTTLSSTRDNPTILPLTLETFSSVSSSFGHSPNGGLYPMYDSHGQFNDFMEHETLMRNKPRPSSTRISFTSSSSNSPPSSTPKTTAPSSTSTSSSSISNTNSLVSSSTNNLALDSTEDPPKISTFMYVDDNNNNNKNKNNNKNVHTSNTFINNNKIINNVRLADNKQHETKTTTMTPITSVEEKTIPSYGHEDLNSNTENIWSVVMQLGSAGGGSHQNPESVSQDDSFPSLDESQMSKLDELSYSLSGGVDRIDNLPEPGTMNSDSFFGNSKPETTGEGHILDNTFLKLKTDSDKEADDGSTTIKIGVNKFGEYFDNDITTEQELNVSFDSENQDDEKSTTRPWASSTYYVHTFKYPNHTSGATNSEQGSTSDEVPVLISSTLPSIGKITTWSGIGSIIDKEHMISKHSESDEDDDVEKNKPLSSLLITKGTTEEPTTTTTTTTTTTPTPTTKRPTTTVTTKYTTRRTTTTTTSKTTTTTEKPEPTTEKNSDKWKKPKPYTLPPHKRPTTTEPTTPKTEPSTRRTTTSTTTKKPKIVTKNSNLKEKEPVNNPSIILDEELDTNLDDFVEQVVQGIAGTLDNLNLDEVILPQLDSGSHFDILDDPTIDSLQDKKKKAGNIATTSTTSTSTTTQKPLDWRKDCGVRTSKKSGRIVGGTASKFGKWPWQALVKEATWLGLFSKNKCGGVLIAPKYVLTAAHCSPGFLATLTVVLGDFDISSNAENNANPITKNVRRVIVHRDYNAQTFENDIALLELDSAVEFAPHIVPICLPTDEEEFIGRSAFVTGWGRLKYGGGVPQTLHEVDVPILKNDECQDMFHKSGHLKAIRDSFICAGYSEGFKDSCEGDSGGPLSIQRSSGQWVLAGTVSHGIKCAYPNLPGVYMRMTFYKPWIKRVTGIK